VAAALENVPPAAGGAGDSHYADWIGEQLAREDARKESLEKRALAVITTSGALATLLFGLTAFRISGSSDIRLSHTAIASIVVAVIAFLISAACAIFINVPVDYQEVKPAELKRAVKERWGDSEREAERMISLTQIKVLESARDKNGRKAWLLFWSIAAQAVAVGAIGVAVVNILT
jgi:hypothetical protein